MSVTEAHRATLHILMNSAEHGKSAQSQDAFTREHRQWAGRNNPQVEEANVPVVTLQPWQLQKCRNCNEKSACECTCVRACMRACMRAC
eukprot:4495804-Amphidinium_carterae.1